MKRLLFIGPAPQNIGGISIHIRRLARLMTNDYRIDYVDEGHIKYDGVFNIRSWNAFKYIGKLIKSDIIHIHSGIWFLRAFHIIISKLILRKRVIVTIHRDPNIEPHAHLTKWLLKQCDCAILVNREGFETMHTKGHCRYMLQPAFLPPDMDEEQPLPEEIMLWLAEMRKHNNAFIMCSNAWNLVLHEGQDLYGLDLCLKAMRRLKDNEEHRFKLIFVVASNIDQTERMSCYKKQIRNNGLENSVLIWEQPTSFVRLLQECDLVLRTTNTDGDAISIREALYYGKRVLASDVVERPEGVELFKTRDVDDLTNKIIALADRGTRVDFKPVVDFHAFYQSVYE